MADEKLIALAERCANCRWRSAAPYLNPDRGSAEFGDIMFACKRRAPVATGGLHTPSMTIWPMVCRDDWCGDYSDFRALAQKDNQA